MSKKTEKKEEKSKDKSTSKEPKKQKTEKKEAKKYNPWNVLKYPHMAEKSMNMVEFENKLVFVVNLNAKKEEIKEAVEKGFDVKVDSVGVEITRKGVKKAYVKLKPDYIASDVASRLGIL